MAEKKRNTSSNSAGRQSLQRSRIWLFTAIIVILIPVAFLGFAEWALRLAGTGHSSEFFLEKREDGNRYLTINHPYTQRFFPQALARAIIPHRIEIPQPEDTYRIVIFGESAANGDPDPGYSFGRHLEVLLENRYPGTRFEVICTAITAINSHVIRSIANDTKSIEADLWIVYMGNNEMIGPYGAGTVFGAKVMPLPIIRANIGLKSTRLGQLAKQFKEGLQANSRDTQTWGGINMFTDNPLHKDDPRRLMVYKHFQRNLHDIVASAESAGVPVLLSTVASNLRDCAPFISLNRSDLSTTERQKWQELYDQGIQAEAGKSYADAIRAYAGAAAIDPTHAELQFRLGRVYGLSGYIEKATAAMTRARDYDALVVRADSKINEIIRAEATNWPDTRVRLVDTVALLAADSPAGIPGREWFYEHVHFTLQGNYQVARIMAETIRPSLPESILAKDTGQWVEPGTCHVTLAITLWDKKRLWSEMNEQLANPPFSLRENNALMRSFCEASAAYFGERSNPRLDRKIYEDAMVARPEDYHLRQHYARYLQLNGDLDSAITHLYWITERFPLFEGAYQELALAHLLAGNYDQAEAAFVRVLELNPYYPRALKGLETLNEMRAQSTARTSDK
jgi:tetratricopeptide (TPR) repeat protein